MLSCCDLAETVCGWKLRLFVVGLKLRLFMVETWRSVEVTQLMYQAIELGCCSVELSSCQQGVQLSSYRAIVVL